VLGFFILVRSPDDAWLVLATMAATAVASFVAALTAAVRGVPFRFPTWRLVRLTLSKGWSLFVFRASVSLYTSANVLILGFFASASVVGFYAAAEKIVKSALGLLTPVSRTLFPRLSGLVSESRARAARLVRAAGLGVGLAALAGAALLAVAAPLVVDLLLGPVYSGTVVLMRILALLLPVIALSNVLGIQWMVPLGLDKQFNRIILSAGALNITLALILAPLFGAVGMALAVVTTEIFVTAVVYVFLKRRALDPFKLARVGG